LVKSGKQTVTQAFCACGACGLPHSYPPGGRKAWDQQDLTRGPGVVAGQAVASDDNRPRASVVCAAEFFWQWQFGDTQYLPLFFGYRPGEGWGTLEFHLAPKSGEIRV
jgi:hypothetical protein